MDLIYANENKQDLGVIDSYTLDMAYGSDENNFVLIVDRNTHCCNAGFYIYTENEEYGGIIDSIKVDTENEEITYSGRTWHGILENKFICPPNGEDYLILNGEANTVLQQIINHLDLGGLFFASSENSRIEIVNFQMERYVAGYTGIKKMLKSSDAKLKLKWVNGLVCLYAEPRVDYSQNDEFDTSQVDFTIAKNFKPTNHIICLGQGNLKERNVIHIFTDENGGIQPYAKTDLPMQDSDYILDERNKLLNGSDEIVEILDNSNAETTVNYLPLNSKPLNWNTNCDMYYFFNEENGKYENVEIEETDNYSLIGSTPSDWKTNYGSYFIRKNNLYSSVTGVTTDIYSKINSKPIDWNNNWSSYYDYYSDGVQSEYRNVDGVTKYRYTVQTQKPTDWKTNYGSYYKKNTSGGFTEVELNNKNQVPSWKPKTFYTKTSYQVAPEFSSENRYVKKTTTSAPAFKTNTYYKLEKKSIIPVWVPDTYFKAVDDHYAVMVASAIEKLNEANASEELSINLAETDRSYDVGDLVGSIESVTGISTVQEVVKKIIKISYNDMTINYEVK